MQRVDKILFVKDRKVGRIGRNVHVYLPREMEELVGRKVDLIIIVKK